MASRRFPARPSFPSTIADAPTGLTISCDDCVMAATDACLDCIVPVLLGDEPSPDTTTELTAGEAVTLCLLQRAGLAPELHHPRHAPVLAGLGGRG